ncbi:MAG: sulfotransferase [Proteobacteria bacterium]|nr:sulfotransferase [Pseudomonadota bacterium]
MSHYAATHLLSSLPGIPLGRMLALLRVHGRRISPAYLPRIAFHLAAGTAVSALALLERLVWGAPPALPASNEPVFVLGHWRSGTTFLHRLLAADPSFAAPTQFEATLPQCFRITESWLKPAVQRALPKTRGYDEVALDLDAAWEDETALFSMTLQSPMLASLFPRDGERHAALLALQNLSERERLAWARALRGFLARIAAGSGNRPLLKSPPHTARVKMLAELYPSARFIHIHRHPYAVYASTLRMMEVFGDQVQLQRPRDGDIDAIVVSHYKAMHLAYFEQRDVLAPDRLFEVGYDEFVADPLGQLERAYRRLALGDFERVRPEVQRHLASVAGHRASGTPALAPALQQRLRREWHLSFDRWGYA